MGKKNYPLRSYRDEMPCLAWCVHLFNGDKMTLPLVAGYENVIEDKDFLIKGIKHDSAVAGKWQGKVSLNPLLLENSSIYVILSFLMCIFCHRISC